MSGVWIPIWIIGAPLVAVIVLSLATKGGSSAYDHGDSGVRGLR